MKLMKFKLIYILIALFVFSNTLHASKKWGTKGHRVVGEIAQSYLKPSAKRKIKKLLNRQSLAYTSTYADEIKSDKRYSEFYTWHFINMPFEDTYETSVKNSKGDLVIGIEFCKNIITDKNASDDDKAFYLKLLIHLVGDLHQPMHIGLEDDRGGNDIKLQWHYRDTNLHKVWDSEMINKYGMSYSELVKNVDYLTKKEVNRIQEGSIIDWVNETQTLTKQVYNSAKEGDNLRYRYSYEYFGIVRSQLQIAGIRLAKVLNDIF